MRTGLLFCASEFSNHKLYAFLDIGEKDPNPIRTYSSQKEDRLVTYNPRELLNLSPVDEF